MPTEKPALPQVIKLKNCGDSNSNVWKSIDQNGQPICADKSAQFAWTAKITEYTDIMKVIRADNTITRISSAGNTHLIQL